MRFSCEPQRLCGPAEAPRFQCQTLPEVDWDALWLVSCNRLLGGGRVNAERRDQQANEQHGRVEKRGQNGGEVEAETPLYWMPEYNNGQQDRRRCESEEIHECSNGAVAGWNSPPVGPDQEEQAADRDWKEYGTCGTHWGFSTETDHERWEEAREGHRQAKSSEPDESYLVIGRPIATGTVPEGGRYAPEARQRDGYFRDAL